MVEKELRKFVDSANTLIFGIDLDGCVNEWNFKTAEITGYSREEAFGKPFVDTFIDPSLQESVREVFDNALQGVETNDYKLSVRTKNNDHIYLLVNASTRWDADNNIIGGKFKLVDMIYEYVYI